MQDRSRISDEQASSAGARDDLFAGLEPSDHLVAGVEALDDLLVAGGRQQAAERRPVPAGAGRSRSGLGPARPDVSAQPVGAGPDDLDEAPGGGRAGRSGRRQRRGAGPAPHPAADEAPGPPGDDRGDPESVARAVCLRALTGAPKTRQQLADLLGRRGVPEQAAEAVLDRFTEVGLIDDAAFARAWVSSRQAGRGLARRALRSELRAKGVDTDVAAQAVELVDDEDERAAAHRLVERRLAAMRRLDRATATRRLIGMLARKGYSGGLAAAVVRQALDEADRPESAAAGAEPTGSDAVVWEDDLP